jgi:hypothetical protein
MKTRQTTTPLHQSDADMTRAAIVAAGGRR